MRLNTAITFLSGLGIILFDLIANTLNAFTSDASFGFGFLGGFLMLISLVIEYA